MSGIQLVIFSLGFCVGLIVTLLVKWLQSRSRMDLAQELFRHSEAQRQLQMEAILSQMKAQFGALSLEALSRSTHELLKLSQSSLAGERERNRSELNEKKSLIDRQLEVMSEQVQDLSDLVKALEKDRAQKFGELANQLRVAGEQTTQLNQTTRSLAEALSSSRSRGQWGERMAEDVLRLAGLIENINYVKQKSIGAGRGRPDFTFLLPRDLKLNMDVKFPLDNYVRYLESTGESEQARYRADFLRDVRNRLKEVASRDYIDAESDTVDYALLFIPNEQIYAFIQEHDSRLIDQGLQQHVIICSPMTLFAVLAVVRQSVENFSLEKTSNEILTLISAFKKQWDEFIKKMDGLGKKIADAQTEFDTLLGVRRRQLELPLVKLDGVRSRRGLPEPEGPEPENGRDQEI